MIESSRRYKKKGDRFWAQMGILGPYNRPETYKVLHSYLNYIPISTFPKKDFSLTPNSVRGLYQILDFKLLAFLVLYPIGRVQAQIGRFGVNYGPGTSISRGRYSDDFCSIIPEMKIPNLWILIRISRPKMGLKGKNDLQW